MQHLSLKRCDVDRAHIFYMICAMPNLEVLMLDDLYFPDASYWTSPTDSSLFRPIILNYLHTLRLSQDEARASVLLSFIPHPSKCFRLYINITQVSQYLPALDANTARNIIIARLRAFWAIMTQAQTPPSLKSAFSSLYHEHLECTMTATTFGDGMTLEYHSMDNITQPGSVFWDTISNMSIEPEKSLAPMITSIELLLYGKKLGHPRYDIGLLTGLHHITIKGHGHAPWLGEEQEKLEDWTRIAVQAGRPFKTITFDNSPHRPGELPVPTSFIERLQDTGGDKLCITCT
jgi:hypothetical protein